MSGTGRKKFSSKVTTRGFLPSKSFWTYCRRSPRPLQRSSVFVPQAFNMARLIPLFLTLLIISPGTSFDCSKATSCIECVRSSCVFSTLTDGKACCLAWSPSNAFSVVAGGGHCPHPGIVACGGTPPALAEVTAATPFNGDLDGSVAALLVGSVAVFLLVIGGLVLFRPKTRVRRNMDVESALPPSAPALTPPRPLLAILPPPPTQAQVHALPAPPPPRPPPAQRQQQQISQIPVLRRSARLQKKVTQVIN